MSVYSEMTKGQQILYSTLGSSKRQDVTTIRSWGIHMYDWLDSQIEKTLVSVEGYGEICRWKAIAHTWLETSVMAMIASVTYTEEIIEKAKVDKLEPTEGFLAMGLNTDWEMTEAEKYIKEQCANMFDYMQDEMYYRNMEMNRKGNTKDEYDSKQMHLFYRLTENSMGYFSDAMYALRQFKMFAVKAVTR